MHKWNKILELNLEYDILYKIMLNFKDYNELISTDSNLLKKLLNVNNDIIKKIYNSNKININKTLDKLNIESVKQIFLNDEDYPTLLKEIAKPPICLYTKGNIDFSMKSIGIAGTRKMTAYGSSATEKIVKELVKNNVAIISGMASGIDTVAHETTLNANGFTVAVLGSGIDVVFPAENKRLYERICENGLVVSEYSFGTPPFRWNFPIRNRIIAGLSMGTAIIESYKRGGALITAKRSLDEGRDVFAVPGFISYPSFEGCNNLIKDFEAKLITSGDDILNEYGWKNKKENKIVYTKDLTKDEKLILNVLKIECTFDSIKIQTKINTQDLLSMLTELEINGLIKSIAGGKYINNY